MNGDGIDDLIIGASKYHSPSGFETGAAYIIFGRKTGFANLDLLATDLANNSLGYKIIGINYIDAFGFSESGLGDINDDDIADVIIGATKGDSPVVNDCGTAHVIFGRKGVSSDIDLNKTALSSTQGFVIYGKSSGDSFGMSVNVAGDVNGDGAVDFLIGARQADYFGRTNNGAAYLIFGIYTKPVYDFSIVATIGRLLDSSSLSTDFATAIISLINFNNPGAICFSSLSAGLKYLKYLKINYPPKLKYLLEQPEPENEVISVFLSPAEELKEKIRKYPLPEIFEEHDLHSSFLVNFWASLLTLLIIAGIIIIVSLVGIVAKKKNLINQIFSKLKEIFKWNYFLITFIGCYGDIGFYGSLEMRSIHFQSFLEGLSIFVCLMINILMIMILIRMVMVIRELRKGKSKTKKNQNSVKLTITENQMKEYAVVFESFKSDSFLQQSFLIIFSIRLLIFYMVLGYLFDHPLVQMILINIMGVSMLLYLGIKRPAKEKIEMVQYFTQEFIFQVVHTCALGLAVLDYWNPDNSGAREVLGEIIIYAFMVFMLVGLAYMGISILKIMIKLMKYLKGKLIKRKVFPKSHLKRDSKELIKQGSIRKEYPHSEKSLSVLENINNSHYKTSNIENSLITNTPYDISIQDQESACYGVKNHQYSEGQNHVKEQVIVKRPQQHVSNQISIDNKETLTNSIKKKRKILRPQKAFQYVHTEQDYASKIQNQNNSAFNSTVPDIDLR